MKQGQTLFRSQVAELITEHKLNGCRNKKNNIIVMKAQKMAQIENWK